MFLWAKPQRFFSQPLSQSGVTSGQKRDPEILCVEVSSAEKSLLPIGSLNQLAVLAQILECEGFLRRVLIASKNKTALKKKKKVDLNHIFMLASISPRIWFHILISTFKVGFYQKQRCISSNLSKTQWTSMHKAHPYHLSVGFPFDHKMISFSTQWAMNLSIFTPMAATA